MAEGNTLRAALVRQGGAPRGDPDRHDRAPVIDHHLQLEAAEQSRFDKSLPGRVFKDAAAADAQDSPGCRLRPVDDSASGLLALEAVNQDAKRDEQPGHLHRESAP